MSAQEAANAETFNRDVIGGSFVSAAASGCGLALAAKPAPTRAFAALSLFLSLGITYITFVEVTPAHIRAIESRRHVQGRFDVVARACDTALVARTRMGPQERTAALDDVRALRERVKKEAAALAAIPDDIWRETKAEGGGVAAGEDWRALDKSVWNARIARATLTEARELAAAMMMR